MGNPSIAWGLFSLFGGIEMVSTDDNGDGIAGTRWEMEAAWTRLVAMGRRGSQMVGAKSRWLIPGGEEGSLFPLKHPGWIAGPCTKTWNTGGENFGGNLCVWHLMLIGSIEGLGRGVTWYLMKKYGSGETLSIIPPHAPTRLTCTPKVITSNLLYLPKPAQPAPGTAVSHRKQAQVKQDVLWVALPLNVWVAASPVPLSPFICSGRSDIHTMLISVVINVLVGANLLQTWTSHTLEENLFGNLKPGFNSLDCIRYSQLLLRISMSQTMLHLSWVAHPIVCRHCLCHLQNAGIKK